MALRLTGNPKNYPAIWAATDFTDQTPPLDPTNPDLIYPGNVLQVPTDLIPDGMGAVPLPADARANEPGTDSGTGLGAGSGTGDGGDGRIPGSGPIGDGQDQADPPSSPTTVAPATGPTSPDVTSSDPTTAAPVSTADGAGHPADDGTAALAVLAGLGALGAGVVLAGVRRRRTAAMAAASDGERPPRRARRSRRVESRLWDRHQADPSLWSPAELVAGWNSLFPDEPGASQPWAIRWNSDTGYLECAWTEDPTGLSNPGTPRPRQAPGPRGS